MLRVLKAEVQAPALFNIYSPFWIHCDEGLVHQILAFESLNDAQFTLSTLLILFHSPAMKHHSFHIQFNPLTPFGGQKNSPKNANFVLYYIFITEKK